MQQKMNAIMSLSQLYFETFLCIMDFKNEQNIFLATFTKFSIYRV